MKGAIFTTFVVGLLAFADAPAHAQFRKPAADSELALPIVLERHPDVVKVHSPDDSRIPVPQTLSRPDSGESKLVTSQNGYAEPASLAQSYIVANHTVLGALIGAGSGVSACLATYLPHRNDSSGEFGTPFQSYFGMGAILYVLPLALIGVLIGSNIYF
jgi:hypothetical protein